MRQALLSPELLKIQVPSGEATTGGSQEWYTDKWQKMSGCGPTAAANLIWYMAQFHPELDSLYDKGNGDRDSFICLMREMFTFIKPGMGGVNTSTIFSGGLVKYGESRGVAFTAHALEIPRFPYKRPSQSEVSKFILSALQANAPVAFLNLSNGTLTNLEGWHWVTIIELETNEETNSMTAHISDQGSTFDIDLSTWLRTSFLGGAMVWLEPS